MGLAERYDLTGRVALVTGGTRGLGRATVRALAEAGADIVVSSRKQDACEEAAEEVRRLGRRALAHACHMGDWDAIERLVEAAYGAFEKVDILVNNAGISPLYPSPEAVTEELWDKTLGVNLKGPFRLSALIGARMREHGGSIVNVSSIGAIRSTGDIIPYAASKAGLNAMTIAMADALGPKVRVNCVMPGAFRTDVTKAWDASTFDVVARTTAMRRMGEPEDMVGTIIYLASDASAYTTGAVFPVHGGAPA